MARQKKDQIGHSGFVHIHSLDFFLCFPESVFHIIHSFIFPMYPRGCSAFYVEWGESDGRIRHCVEEPITIHSFPSLPSLPPTTSHTTLKDTIE